MTTDHTSYETTGHVVYAICSRTREDLPCVQLAQIIRNHWKIEVRLHGQRDVRMREDANKTTIGHAPRALACLRNWAIALVERYQRIHSLPRIAGAWQALQHKRGEAIEFLTG